MGGGALFLLLLDRVFQVNKTVSNPLHSSLKRYNDEMKPWKNLRLESGRSVENLPITFTSMFNHPLVSAFQWQIKIETRQSKSVNEWNGNPPPPPPPPPPPNKWPCKRCTMTHWQPLWRRRSRHALTTFPEMAPQECPPLPQCPLPLTRHLPVVTLPLPQPPTVKPVSHLHRARHSRWFGCHWFQHSACDRRQTGWLMPGGLGAQGWTLPCAVLHW